MKQTAGARPRWITALALVMAAHLLLGASALQWHHRTPMPEQPTAMLIELAPQPVAAPQPVPEPAVQPPQAKPVAPPAKAKPLLAKPAARPKPAERAQPAPAQPLTTVASEPARAKPTTNTVASAKTIAVTWQSRLLSHLARFQRYPEDARRRGIHGMNSLRLVIDGSGRVETFTLVSASGNRSLDRATLAMIRRAQPLPPPPAELLAGGRVEVIAPVNYTLDRR